MKSPETKKIIKNIRVDVSKCTGCFTCEIACSASHATPPYSGVNPARSRIRVLMDETQDIYHPVRAASNVRAECEGRNVYALGGKEYTECGLCASACPSRANFIEPDSGLPLKCDMCEGLDVETPLCVQVCHPGALTLETREVEVQAPERSEPREREEGLRRLVAQFGMDEVVAALSRLVKK